MRILRSLFFAVAVLTLSACDVYDVRGFFTSPSKRVEERFRESMTYNEQHKADTLVTASDDSYRIYVCSDIHVNTKDALVNFPIFLRNAYSDLQTAVVVLDGDLTNCKGGLAICKDTLDGLACEIPVKYVAGNHDLLFEQWDEFLQIYGSSTYHFVVQTPNYHDLYICLESGSGTLGKAQLKWLEDILAQKAGVYRHTVVFTHVNFWDTDLSQIPSANFAIQETAHLTNIFSKNGVEYVVTGHDHYREVVTLNGTIYITMDALKDGVSNASYFIMNISEGITHEFKEL